jgi:hypothetical protein
MHPLSDNLKSLTFEELEKRSSELLKRMQMLRRAGISNPDIWDQLHMLLDSIADEKTERVLVLNNKNSQTSVVINTDPLDDDEMPPDAKSGPKGFTPIS